MLEASRSLAILLLNGVLGFVQEYRAEQALEALKQLAAPTATVVRDGVEREIAAERARARRLVLLERATASPPTAAWSRPRRCASTRRRSPARARRRASTPSAVEDADAAARRPAQHGVRGHVGRRRPRPFVVTATGQHTEMGKIADLLADAGGRATPLQHELRGRRQAHRAPRARRSPRSSSPRSVCQACRAAARCATFGTPRSARRDRRAARRGLARGRRHPRGPARDRHRRALARRAPHGRAQRHRAQAARGRDARLDDVHLLRQDRHAHPQRDDGARGWSSAPTRVDVLPDWAIEPEPRRPTRDDRELLLEIAASCNDARFAADGELLGDPTETALLVAADQLAPEHAAARGASARCRSTPSASA